MSSSPFRTRTPAPSRARSPLTSLQTALWSLARSRLKQSASEGAVTAWTLIRAVKPHMRGHAGALRFLEEAPADVRRDLAGIVYAAALGRARASHRGLIEAMYALLAGEGAVPLPPAKAPKEHVAPTPPSDLLERERLAAALRAEADSADPDLGALLYAAADLISPLPAGDEKSSAPWPAIHTGASDEDFYALP